MSRLPSGARFTTRSTRSRPHCSLAASAIARWAIVGGSNVPGYAPRFVHDQRDDLDFLAEPERRAGEVDEASFVVEQRLAGGDPFRRGRAGCERVEIVPPQFGHAVERLERFAARSERVVERRVDAVELHVAADAECLLERAHERSVLVAPVPMELLGFDVVAAAHAEAELDHCSLLSTLLQR